MKTLSVAAAFLSVMVLHSVAQTGSAGVDLKFKIIPNQPTLEMDWSARLTNKDGQTILPAFELQRSFDLRIWQPVGERLRGEPIVPNEILSMRVLAGLARAFYRGVALPDRPAAQ